MEELTITEQDLKGLQDKDLELLSHCSSRARAVASVVLSRAGRSTPLGTYVLVSGRWCLAENEEASKLKQLAEAALCLLGELAPFCVHQAHDYRSRLGMYARWLEKALRQVPGFAERELPGTRPPYPWTKPTLDGALDAAGFSKIK